MTERFLLPSSILSIPIHSLKSFLIAFPRLRFSHCLLLGPAISAEARFSSTFTALHCSTFHRFAYDY
jgi:hypothetical protein